MLTGHENMRQRTASDAKTRNTTLPGRGEYSRELRGGFVHAPESDFVPGPGLEGRSAHIKATVNVAVPLFVQKVMLQSCEHLVREIAAGRNAQLAQPEKRCKIILDMAKHLEQL